MTVAECIEIAKAWEGRVTEEWLVLLDSHGVYTEGAEVDESEAS